MISFEKKLFLIRMRFFSKGLFLPKMTIIVYKMDNFLVEMEIFDA